ncbi:MAG: hypothetical protein ACE5JS_14770 [Nitrospinota bacterium]
MIGTEVDTATERLERENRWMKAIGCTDVAVLGLDLFLGATESEETKRTEEFREIRSGGQRWEKRQEFRSN